MCELALRCGFFCVCVCVCVCAVSFRFVSWCISSLELPWNHQNSRLFCFVLRCAAVVGFPAVMVLDLDLLLLSGKTRVRSQERFRQSTECLEGLVVDNDTRSGGRVGMIVFCGGRFLLAGTVAVAVAVAALAAALFGFGGCCCRCPG